MSLDMLLTISCFSQFLTAVLPLSVGVTFQPFQRGGQHGAGNFRDGRYQFPEPAGPLAVQHIEDIGAPFSAETVSKHHAKVMGQFGCLGYDTFGPFKLVGGIAKGHPDEKDLENVRRFYEGL